MTLQDWQRIDELFQMAIDKTAAERPSFLAELGYLEADVYREVVSLVAAYEEAAGFLSMPPLFEQSVAPLALAAGSLCGPYRIDREIGTGGMGTVFAAARSDGQFERHVALKVVRTGLRSESILARFRAERQILAALNHPNIARLLDGGVTLDGQPYLVTELVDGVALDQYCTTLNLTIDARLDLFGKLCSAVHYAHQRMVIHRDLKPSNILVDKNGEPKLLDFGIAKLVDAEYREQIQQTKTLRLLTPRYASPEQLTAQAITTASDIYALGVVLYELLAGRHPFANTLNKPGEMRKAVLASEPQPPSRFEKQLRGDLDNIVLMALRKEPERRYRSAAQLADDLRRSRENLPVAARQETVLYVSSKFVKRHWQVTLAAAAAFSLLAGGLAVTAYEAHVADQERIRAEFVEKFVKTALSGADPTYNSPFADKGRDLRVADVLDVAVQRARSELRNQPSLKSELLRDLATGYLRLGLNVEGERLLREADGGRTN